MNRIQITLKHSPLAVQFDDEIQEIFTELCMIMHGRKPDGPYWATDSSLLANIMLRMKDDEREILIKLSEKYGVQFHQGMLFIDAAKALRDSRVKTAH